jgi:hypothetical protein
VNLRALTYTLRMGAQKGSQRGNHKSNVTMDTTKWIYGSYFRLFVPGRLLSLVNSLASSGERCNTNAIFPGRLLYLYNDFLNLSHGYLVQFAKADRSQKAT